VSAFNLPPGVGVHDIPGNEHPSAELNHLLVKRARLQKELHALYFPASTTPRDTGHENRRISKQIGALNLAIEKARKAAK
jgi:hypothetical protein